MHAKPCAGNKKTNGGYLEDKKTSELWRCRDTKKYDPGTLQLATVDGCFCFDRYFGSRRPFAFPLLLSRRRSFFSFFAPRTP